jgi:hypothetical protein
MSNKDRFGTRDSLGATISVPEGEEHLVEGLEPQDESPPTEPKPATFDTEIRETSKGFGVYISAQDAPLTLANVTWFPDAISAQKAVEKFHEDFGWRWVQPVREEHIEEQPDPNNPDKTRKVRIKGEVTKPGYWTNDYGLVFDPATAKALMGQAETPES